MKTRFTLLSLIIAAAATLCASCGNNDPKPSGGQGDESDDESIFAKGADISWATEMERDGIRFRTADGIPYCRRHRNGMYCPDERLGLQCHKAKSMG